ncbi:MBL fold metallo-hydrolase [Amycolatopsis sp. FDAARGOS 1241]|nr:MBL fold metallo-hydrolase [Amycolatopsis sp. FDAARGOS 1241]
MSTLTYDVLVTADARRERGQTLPTGEPIISSPVSITLVSGAEDAVLVDPPFLDFQIQEVADWVARSGKRLRHVFATHGHGDHWFGTAELLKRFPGAQVHATSGTIEVIREQAVEGRAQMWDLDFPGRIPPSPCWPSRSPTRVSCWRATSCGPSTSGTPTPTRRRCCTCRHSASWSPVTPSTTESTSTSSKAATAACRSGSPRSTGSSSCARAPSWRATRTRRCPTTRAPSPKPARTCST